MSEVCEYEYILSGNACFFAVWVYKKVMKNVTAADMIIHYGIFSVIINIVCFLICIVLSGVEYVLNFEFAPLSFIVKYLLLAVGIAIFFSVIYCLISRRFELQIEIAHQNLGDKKDEE